MGNGNSRKKGKVAVEETLEEKYAELCVTENTAHILNRLNIEPKWGFKFYELFCIADADGGGDIDVDEYHDFFGINRAPFTDMAFGMQQMEDVDDSANLDFNEFMSGTWEICSSTEAMLVKFAFSLYDTDGSGVLDMVKHDVTASSHRA